MKKQTGVSEDAHEGPNAAGGGGSTATLFARTREQDRLDVLSGKRSAEYLHFIPRALARLSKRVFPGKYRKS